MGLTCITSCHFHMDFTSHTFHYFLSNLADKTDLPTCFRHTNRMIWYMRVGRYRAYAQLAYSPRRGWYPIYWLVSDGDSLNVNLSLALIERAERDRSIFARMALWDPQGYCVSYTGGIFR